MKKMINIFLVLTLIFYFSPASALLQTCCCDSEEMCLHKGMEESKNQDSETGNSCCNKRDHQESDDIQEEEVGFTIEMNMHNSCDCEQHLSRSDIPINVVDNQKITTTVIKLYENQVSNTIDSFDITTFKRDFSEFRGNSPPDTPLYLQTSSLLI